MLRWTICPRCKNRQQPLMKTQQVKGGVITFLQCRHCGITWNRKLKKDKRK